MAEEARFGTGRYARGRRSVAGLLQVGAAGRCVAMLVGRDCRLGGEGEG